MIVMKVELIIIFYQLFKCCGGVRLNPLENNDKLQDIDNQYVAEWQWESWPIKQESTEQDSKSPGPRINVALWKDSSKNTWYLFGGEPVDTESKKIYSDVWKYSALTRTWERFFPAQSNSKETNTAKIGGMMTLRASLFDEVHTFTSKPKNRDIVLCGGITTSNLMKPKKNSVWNNFSRRKKLGEKEKDEEPKSLTVYTPRTSKSSTVWQIDLKEKLWTAYVCCCDASDTKKINSSIDVVKIDETLKNKKNYTESYLKSDKRQTESKNESSVIDQQINKAEEKEESEQQHLAIKSLKNQKKKINQSKKTVGNSTKKVDAEKKYEMAYKETPSSSLVGETVESKNESTISVIVSNETNTNLKLKKEKYSLKLKNRKVDNKTKKVDVLKLMNKSENRENKNETKSPSKYCPEFSEDNEPVTWCDGNSEILITADIRSSQIILWTFDLKISHWSQHEVNISDDVEWPGCSTEDPVRYAGDQEEIYIICSPFETLSNITSESLNNSRILSKNPFEGTINSKVVYRINYKRRLLESLGKIKLPVKFDTAEGKAIWKKDSKLIFNVVRIPDNKTVLLFAYLGSVDLYILTKDQQGKEYFDLMEKIWRGSALKWFSKYNSALYNMQFVTESQKTETILVPNPRNISLGDYWPRERGRFIIRIFKNENFKNQSFENRTREQNLTYELLQSEIKTLKSENQLNHAYNLKVFVFFAISLAIFCVFGFAIFLKRCVNCPPKIRVRNECHKSPLVIRYSVIPDDLLYPIA